MASSDEVPRVVVGYTGKIAVVSRPESPQFSPDYLRQVSGKEVVTNLDITAGKEFLGGEILFGAGWVALCCPSPEAVKGNQSSQDKMGVILLNKEQILVLQADGVGSSYYAENAAGYAVRRVGEKGTGDLQENLNEIGDEFKNWGANVRPRLDQPALKYEADNISRTETGSFTTFNQYLLNRETGNYLAHGLGDGFVAVVRTNGRVEKFEMGSHKNRLSTKSGIEGKQAEFRGRLDDGDTLFVFSDGLDGVADRELREARDVIAKNDPQEITAFLERLIGSLSRDDDRSLFAYRHQAPVS